MAHEIRTHDLHAYSKEGAWHGYGTVVPEGMTLDQAADMIGIRAPVRQLALFAELPTLGIDADGNPCETTQRVPVDTHVLNWDTHAGIPVGLVGSKYTVLQGEDLLAFIRAVARTSGVPVETIGTLRDRKEVFVLVHLDAFEAMPGDVVHEYALFTNSHDGSSAFQVLPTRIRVVCKNTQRMALSRSDALTVRIPHTRNFMAYVDEAASVLRGEAAPSNTAQERAGVDEAARILQSGTSAVAAASASLTEGREATRAMVERRMTGADLTAYFGQVYQDLYGDPPTGDYAQTRGGRAKTTRARKMARAWRENVEADAATFGASANAWLAANAVTKWIDHERTVRGGNRQHSNLVGTAADAKDVVFAAASTLL